MGGGNPEEPNEKVRLRSRKTRLVVAAALGLSLVAGGIGAAYAYNYAQECSVHNQELEQIYDDSLNVAKALIVDQNGLTFEDRLASINDAAETKACLQEELKQDKYKYADGTSPDWDAVVACYDQVVADCKAAQIDEWNAKITEHAKFDVDSTEDIAVLEEHINALNGLNASITNEDARELILDNNEESKGSLEHAISEQVNRYQTRIDAIKQAQKEAEERRQAEAAAAAAAAAAESANSYGGGESSDGGFGYSDGGSGSGSSGSETHDGKVVVAWKDYYDENGNFITREYRYSDGTYSNPYEFGW